MQKSYCQTGSVGENGARHRPGVKDGRSLVTKVPPTVGAVLFHGTGKELSQSPWPTRLSAKVLVVHDPKSGLEAPGSSKFKNFQLATPVFACMFCLF